MKKLWAACAGAATGGIIVWGGAARAFNPQPDPPMAGVGAEVDVR